MARNRQLNVRVTEEELEAYRAAADQPVEVRLRRLIEGRTVPEGTQIKAVGAGEVFVPPPAAPKAKVEVIKTGLCPHRVPRGTFCKRCATGG